MAALVFWAPVAVSEVVGLRSELPPLFEFELLAGGVFLSDCLAFLEDDVKMTTHWLPEVTVRVPPVLDPEEVELTLDEPEGATKENCWD